MHQYFLLNKPFQVLSQFTSEGGKKSLTDIVDVPKDVYPVGRLDYDSEGLLILTNDPTLNHRLLHPAYKHEREYWVQVEGLITPQALRELSAGVVISIDGKSHHTLPCTARILELAALIHERVPAIRYRKNIPDSWLSLSLTEGKNRQVRRMTAKVGFPTLRLIRYRIEKVTLQGIEPGMIKEIRREELYKQLFG
jgi:23S rRNA pseudouridine2457 synthase